MNLPASILAHKTFPPPCITTTGNQRAPKPKAVLRTSGVPAYYIGLMFLIMFGIVYYVALWVYKSETSVRKDLHRLSATRRQSSWKFWEKK